MPSGSYFVVTNSRTLGLGRCIQGVEMESSSSACKVRNRHTRTSKYIFANQVLRPVLLLKSNDSTSKYIFYRVATTM